MMNNGAQSRLSEPDALDYLSWDIARLPIITSPHQEIWLGVQLQASSRFALINAKWRSNQPPIPFSNFYWAHLFSRWIELETEILGQGIPIPSLGVLGSELVHARHNLQNLHRSRLRRLLRHAGDIEDAEKKETIFEIIYDCIETLAILSIDNLRKLSAIAKDFDGLPPISVTEQWSIESSEMIEKWLLHNSENAKHLLTTGYLRYAIRVAQGYIDQGLDTCDLVQAGFIGLMKAAERYDYRSNGRFGNYAVSWIWQSITREIADQSRTIRLPVHLHETLHRWNTACRQFDDGLRDPAHNPEILFHMGLLDEAAYKELVEADRHTEGHRKHLGRDTQEQFEQAIRKAHKLCANDVKTCRLEDVDAVLKYANGYYKAIPLGEVLPTELFWDENAEDALSIRQLVEDEIFTFLSERERSVLTLRHGWDNGEERTLEEIGRVFQLTRERIRQIESKAINKIKYRIANGRCPGMNEWKITPKRVLPLMTNVRFVLPKLEYEQDDEEQDRERLDSMLSSLPHGDRILARTGPQGGQRRDQLAFVLEQFSAPAHVSDIAEQLNEMVAGEALGDEYVYSLLMRDEEIFICLGQGIFGLVSWEQSKTHESKPVLSCCPIPTPDPPDQEDAFFESVLIGQQSLGVGLTASQFLQTILGWAKADQSRQRWFLQNLLNAYYLVDLIPFTFHYSGENSVLECTLPVGSVQDLRYHCLKSLTDRLAAMPEFWRSFQLHQPIRPTDLGDRFSDIHPFGLDDVLQRLRMLTSLGAAHKSRYGHYRLSSLGEECANQWGKDTAVSMTAPITMETVSDFVELAYW